MTRPISSRSLFRPAAPVDQSILAEHNLNIATLRLTRKARGGDAFMVIEIDDVPSEEVRDEIRALPWVRWAFRLDKVSA